jgi:O-acetyl-ADP-ribose deacetylase
LIQVVRGDITELEVDVIVNAANSQLMVGGGVDYAIHQAAGPGLKNEIDSQAKYLEPGDVLLTSGYRLPAKFVIHTVAPIWNGGTDLEVEVLISCYASSVELALKKGLKSIAFPALGTGAFGVPVEVSAEAAARAIAEFELDDDFQVILCCYTEEDYEIYTSTIQRLIDDAEQNRKLPNCGFCFWPLMPIVYGMLAPSDKDDFIAGGCSIMPGAPQIGCKNCGWEGENPEEQGRAKEVVFAVVDSEENRFSGGAAYEPHQLSPYPAIIPGGAYFPSWDLRDLQEMWAKAKSPTLWIGTEDELIEGALKRLVTRRYQNVTEEVMEFAGFREIAQFPRFHQTT